MTDIDCFGQGHFAIVPKQASVNDESPPWRKRALKLMQREAAVEECREGSRRSMQPVSISGDNAANNSYVLRISFLTPMEIS